MVRLGNSADNDSLYNPRYDHNINYCHEMSPEEQEELFMFVESRKEKAQGQGEVKSFKKKNKKVRTS